MNNLVMYSVMIISVLHIILKIGTLFCVPVLYNLNKHLIKPDCGYFRKSFTLNYIATFVTWFGFLSSDEKAYTIGSLLGIGNLGVLVLVLLVWGCMDGLFKLMDRLTKMHNDLKNKRNLE